MSNTKGMYLGFKPKDVEEKVWCAVVKAIKNGLSDREAAFRASADSEVRITASDIKKWKKDNPDVAELFEMLKDDLKATAKTNIAKLLKNKDDKTSRWYLERKCPEEFSTKAAVAFEGQVVTASLSDKEAALKELVEKYKNGEQ